MFALQLMEGMAKDHFVQLQLVFQLHLTWLESLGDKNSPLSWITATSPTWDNLWNDLEAAMCPKRGNILLTGQSGHCKVVTVTPLLKSQDWFLVVLAITYKGLHNVAPVYFKYCLANWICLSNKISWKGLLGPYSMWWHGNMDHMAGLFCYDPVLLVPAVSATWQP